MVWVSHPVEGLEISTDYIGDCEDRINGHPNENCPASEKRSLSSPCLLLFLHLGEPDVHMLTASSYHDALASLSYRFVHLVEEAFNIPPHTFDAFFSAAGDSDHKSSFLPPQHRLKLLKYPPARDAATANRQGVGAHKDSSGWLTFLYQVGSEPGLEVLGRDGTWMAAPPLPDTFVVNFGNAFEAATDGAVCATVHRVRAPRKKTRYSIPFFMGLPLDLTVSEIRSYIPESVKRMRRDDEGEEAVRKTAVSSFLDPRWDSLGESQLRKWIRSHEDVARKWYGDEVTNYYVS